jgi:2-dehydropantoate 2-reductase
MGSRRGSGLGARDSQTSEPRAASPEQPFDTIRLVKVAVFGTGGVGGYFGARLADGGADVTFIARGAHLEAMRARGLTLQSPLGDLHLERVNATANPSDIGAVDVVLFTVKLYDTDAACAMLGPLIGPNTVVVTLQNGIESTGMLTAAVGRAHVAGGVAHVFAVIAEPGVIRHTALNQITVGELDGPVTPRLEALRELSSQAGFDCRLSEQIEMEIWLKFVRLAAFSGVTSVTRSALGVIREDPDLFAMLQAAVMEGMAVAHAKGIQLPQNALAEMFAHMAGMPPQTKSSMLYDLEHGRRLELPWLSGAVLRTGRELNVETPIHRFITTVLSPFVQGRAL